MTRYSPGRGLEKNIVEGVVVKMESEKQTVKVEIFEQRCIWPESRRHSYRHNELLYEETFEFEEGKMYGILGEHGEGGGGLSWLLSGRDVIRDEKITVFGKEYKKGETVEEGWYLGEGIPGMDKSARKEIAAALKMSKSRLSVQDIVDKFHLTEDRLDVKVQYYSWEIWRLSAAIGYALGKKIFCFPAIDTLKVTEIVTSTAFFIYVEKLRREGCILLLPSSNREVLESVTDEIIELNNPRFRDLSHFHELVRSYKEGNLFYQWAVDD